MKRISILAGTVAVMSFCASGADIWLEAESFNNKGGWVVDQQFTHIMGSSYLMAHGAGIPVADAKTTLTVPENGNYRVWARTYNWTSPWTDKKGPGVFNIAIDGKKLKNRLGDHGNKWEWQYAGEVNLAKGQHEISLNDLTGFNGRCDAIYLTTDKENNIPDKGPELDKIRRTMMGLDNVKPKDEKYDFVVVGGGVAGMCAAVAAARNGVRTALVNDRPILGGNNSSEIRVHLGGSSELTPYKSLGRMIREFGHSKPGNAMPASNYEDEKKDSFIAAEPLVTLYPSYKAIGVEKNGEDITKVLIKNIESGEEILLSAPLFADCTGDGTIGFLAGADYMMGRESRDQYGESLAPEQADSLVMGASVQWYSVKNPKPVPFPEFSYGLVFNDSTCERVDHGEWTWETGMNRNQIDDAERIRDYGLLAVLSNWSYLKNHLKENEEYRNRSIEWIAYIAGKRESRRLLGDYVLKQDDVDKNVFHEDRSFTTSWTMDLHFADPKNSKNFPGNEFKATTAHTPLYPYAVPYRCLYSRNVPNLLMAGRDISATHVAFGSTRLMRTGAMMGEVVGMAASLCKKYDTTPRGIYQQHLGELKKMMSEGAGRPAETLPDNQHFNENRKLNYPRLLNEDAMKEPLRIYEKK